MSSPSIMSGQTEGFDSWAIVEVMGFKKLAGHVTEQQIAGASLLRVDVSEVQIGDTIVPAYSKLIGVGSIYMITPTDEETARKAAKVLARQNDPLPIYIPPEQKQIAAPVVEPEGDWDYDPDDELREELNQDAIDEQIMAEGDAAQALEDHLVAGDPS